MSLRVWRFLALLVAAFSLGPSFAHVLEAAPRLSVWSPDLWREATVFNGQFLLFGQVGAFLDAGAVLATIILALASRGRQFAFGFAVLSAALFILALGAWFAIVAPANNVLATWRPGPIPPDFLPVQLRWETGHMVVAALKGLGFTAVVLSSLSSLEQGGIRRH